MCGIAAVFSGPHGNGVNRAQVMEMSKVQRHRGPDCSGVWVNKTAALAHERLAIVDPSSVPQPICAQNCVLTVNGEIYNHVELKHELGLPIGGSDCEVIIPLYKKYGVECVSKLDGMFAFVLYDTETDTHIAARDHMGKVPMYVAGNSDEILVYASEMKALTLHNWTNIRVFPTGTVWHNNAMTTWYAPAWLTQPSAALDIIQSASAEELRVSLTRAVKKRLMSDVPWGILLSGGLDSSLVAAIACREVPPSSIHTFSIGLRGSPDTAAAIKVSEFLGTTHHAFEFTPDEGLDALSDVVYHTETYDVTTIRASTPMYLLARKIKALGIKMVLSGEGSDEIFGGYLYFHKAPTAAEFHDETVRKLKSLHLYDCLRANKSMAAWGVEARMPFLDTEFLELAMGRINPVDKMCGSTKIEKFILRNAFAGYLPHEILWRQKEQFSDGVGYAWIDSLKARAELQAELLQAQCLNGGNNGTTTVASKESQMYMQMFSLRFSSSQSAARTVPTGPSVACSTPAAIAWDAAFQRDGAADPSGRSVAVHMNSSVVSHK